MQTYLKNLQDFVELAVSTGSIAELQALHDCTGELFRRADEALNAGKNMEHFDASIHDN